MATWGVHMMIVDELYHRGLSMDNRGFTVGNIAPDCNVENEDWTAFEPPRAVTHWMSSKKKLSADYEGFYNKYIKGRNFDNTEEKAFLYGYYAHLITDVEFQKFVRNEERISEIYDRIKSAVGVNEIIIGKPENFDTLKNNLGKAEIFLDIYAQEMNYFNKNEKSNYNTILKNIVDFNDYIDYMPKGAISRKLKIIIAEYSSNIEREKYIFFTEEDINRFVKNTCSIIEKEFYNKKVW